MIRRKRKRRVLSWIVAFVMVLGLMAPSLMAVYAEEAVPDNEATESVEENSEEPVYAAMGMSLPEPEVQKTGDGGFVPEPVGDGDVDINSTNFPDNNFRDYVGENFDGSKDNKLNEEEIDAVTAIDVRGMNIRSLVGIQYFINLTSLNCSDNNMITLDSLCTLYNLSTWDASRQISPVPLRSERDGSKHIFNLAEFVGQDAFDYIHPASVKQADGSDLPPYSYDSVNGIITVDTAGLISGIRYIYGGPLGVSGDLNMDVTVDLQYTYIVTVNPNNGIDGPERLEKAENTSYYLPYFTFNMPEGKQFKCWQVRPAGQEIVEMDQGDEITITADTEIRAIYETAGSDPGDGGDSDKNGDDSDKKGTPETGDNSAASLGVFLMILSAGIFLMMLLGRREDA